MTNKNIFVKKNKLRQISSLYLAGRVFDSFQKRPLSAVQLLKRSIKGIGLISASVLAAKHGFSVTGKLPAIRVVCGCSSEKVFVIGD